MSRKVKERAFEEEGSAIGHNGDSAAADKKCVEKVAKLEEERRAIAGNIKDILNKHKDAYGTPKQSIRKAVKILAMTEEQFQAKKEIDFQAQAIIQLFVDDASGQYSFLSQDVA